MYRDDLREIQKSDQIVVDETELERFFKSKVWTSIMQVVIKEIAQNEDTLRYVANDFIAVTEARASLNRLEWFVEIDKLLITQHIMNRAKDAGANWQAKAKEITESSEYFKKKLCPGMERDTIDVVKLIETYVSKYGDLLNVSRSNRNE